MAVQNRKVYMDILRILAIFMILYNHTGQIGFSLYTVRTEGILYWIYLFLAISVKNAVPLFFMISGALLLGKEESFQELFRKRILRILAALAVGSVVHYLYFCKFSLSSISVLEFLTGLYEGELVIQYWYLYSYLAYLLLLPFLRAMVKNMEMKHLTYLLLLYLGMKLLEIIEFFFWNNSIVHNHYVSFFITGENIIYPVLGYLTEQQLSKRVCNKKGILTAGVLYVAATMISCILTYQRSVLMGMWEEGNTQTFFQTFLPISATALYLIVKYIVQNIKIKAKISKLLTGLGTCTFGIYLFETIFREQTKFIFQILDKFLPTFPACVLWLISAVGIAGVVVWILKQIPVVRKIL